MGEEDLKDKIHEQYIEIQELNKARKFDIEYNKYLQKEIIRLNNIINELEKELEERYLDFKDSECEEVRTVAYEDISILQKIKELKGSESNE